MTDIEETQLRSELETLRRLHQAHEDTALAQAALAERALAAAVDSTAQVERQIRQMLEIMEASSECVLVLDRDWTTRYMNSQSVQMMPGKQSVVGQRIQDAFPDLESTSFWPHYLTAMNDRVPVAFEDFYPPTDRWYAINLAPVGEGIAVFFRDVTKRKQQDAMLQRTEKLAAVGRLASSISHEINNPLESIVNLLYLIEHSDSAGDEMRSYASLAASELARVSQIVTHTLKFHRQSTRAGECRMSEILESVLNLYQGRLATQKVVILRDYAPNDKIFCFAGDLRQVFANLIGNALDALRGEGILTLRTRFSQHWQHGAPGLRVMVADTGCGMSEATRRRIFEAFFTTKATTGTGLGLWVSEEIIRNHKGHVHVKSCEKPGKSGTVFSIYFPTGEGDAERPPSRATT